MAELNEHQLEELEKGFECESNLFGIMDKVIEKLADERKKKMIQNDTIDNILTVYEGINLIHSAIEDVLSGNPVGIQAGTELFEIFDNGGNKNDLNKWMNKWKNY